MSGATLRARLDDIIKSQNAMSKESFCENVRRLMDDFVKEFCPLLPPHSYNRDSTPDTLNYLHEIYVCSQFNSPERYQLNFAGACQTCPYCGNETCNKAPQEFIESDYIFLMDTLLRGSE